MVNSTSRPSHLFVGSGFGAGFGIPFGIALFGMSVAAISANAFAGASIELETSVLHESYGYPTGNNRVETYQLMVSPTWTNDDWKLQADIPFLSRASKFSGSIPVWQEINLQWVEVNTPVSGIERDTGTGDTNFEIARYWSLPYGLSANTSTYGRLPTKRDISTRPASAMPVGGPAQVHDVYVLDSDGIDLRPAIGLTWTAKHAWLSVEPAWVWTSATGMQDHDAFYAGIAITPAPAFEISAEYDLEGESSAGAGDYALWTHTLKWFPSDRLKLALAHYEDETPALERYWMLSITIFR